MDEEVQGTKRVEGPRGTRKEIEEPEDAKEDIVGARVEVTSPSSVGRRAPSRVKMKSTWGVALRRSTGVSGTITCEAWIDAAGKEVETMVEPRKCRVTAAEGGWPGERSREVAGFGAPGGIQGWRAEPIARVGG